MKWSVPCISMELQAVALRYGNSSNATKSALKKSLRAAEQDRPDVARARRSWKRRQGMLNSTRLVFIDETAANTKMVRLSGRCPRGQRLVGCIPQGHWKTLTFVAGLRRNGMTAPCVVDGSMNGKTFLAYVEQSLAPTLKRHEVVIMDNLPAHKVPGVQEAIEARGATVRYLPQPGRQHKGLERIASGVRCNAGFRPGWGPVGVTPGIAPDRPHVSFRRLQICHHMSLCVRHPSAARHMTLRRRAA